MVFSVCFFLILKKKLNARDTFLNQFRGQTIGSVTDESTTEESFQNKVLRPILKLQNDLFIASFVNYIDENKVDFNSKTIEAKLAVIDNAIQKDIKFRNEMKGIIVGLFTIDEYSIYTKNASNINKRIKNMLLERLKSQVQLFDN